MDESGLEVLLRERVRGLAGVLEDLAPPAPDSRPLVAKGIRQRRLHRASLGAALAAVTALIAVVGLRADPSAEPLPDFVRQPHPSAVPSSVGSATPDPTAADDPDHREAGGPQTAEAGSEQGPLTSEVPGCLPANGVPAPEGVAVTLTLDDRIYARDAAVRMELAVANTSERPVAYRRTGQRYDFWIQRDDGVIWTWSFGRRFQDVLGDASIAPGEQLLAQASWDQSRCAPDAGGGVLPGAESFDGPPPGRYVARALWRTEAGGWWSNPVEFVVL